MATHVAAGSSSTLLGSSFSGSRKSLIPHRLNASQGRSDGVLEEASGLYTLESYGIALPLEFKQLLKRDKCVSLDPGGWAVGMDSNKVLLCSLSSSERQKPVDCVQLPLPPGPTWLPQLVAVHSPAPALHAVLCVAGGGAMLACPALGPSPAPPCHGLLPLEREDCVTAVCTVTDGFVVSTARRKVFAVRVSKVGMQARQLEEDGEAQGMLSFVSRRVSSLFFRAPGQQKLLQALPSSSAGNQVLFLFERVIELRQIDWEQSKILYTCEISEALREAVGGAMAESEEDRDLLCQGLVWAVRAVCEVRDRLVFLVGGVSPLGEGSVQLYLVVAKQPSLALSKPSLEVEAVVDLAVSMTEEGELSDLLQPYTLMPTASPNHVVVMAAEALQICQVTGPSPAPEPLVVSLRTYGPVRGSGCVCGHSLVLSESCGLLSVRPLPPVDTPPAAVTPATPATRYTSHLSESVARTPRSSLLGTPLKGKPCSQEAELMKRSFALYCEQKVTEAVEVCKKSSFYEVFTQQCGCRGDAIVFQLSEAIVDDYPAADPRWAESSSAEVSTHGSVIIGQQLQDKLFVHSLFLEHLEALGLGAGPGPGRRLGSVMVRGSPLSSGLGLGEHGEKLLAALALKEAQASLAPLKRNGATVVDLCIKKVLSSRKLSTKNTKLTEQDLFYRQVSLVDDIFGAMRDLMNDQGLLGNNTAYLWALYGSAVVAKELLSAVLRYREQHLALYQAAKTMSNVWTFNTALDGVRSSLHSIVARIFSDVPASGEDNQKLWRVAADITELVLREYTQLNPVLGDSPEADIFRKEYEQERSVWIHPFVESQPGIAAELAEQFEDFHTLVEVYDRNQDKAQLERLVERYQQQGFHEVLFSYYVEKGKYSALLNQPLEHRALLSDYLARHGNPHLVWINGVTSGDFPTSSTALLELAQEEPLLMKRKTLLSLGKLCARLDKDGRPGAGSKEESLAVIDHQLRLASLQESIPSGMLRAYGLEPLHPRTLTGQELVDCYTRSYCELDPEQSQRLFMCALDAASLVGQESKALGDRLKVEVWVRAVLKDRDSWTTLSTDDYTRSLQSTFFFQLVAAIFTSLSSQQLETADLSEGLAYLVDREELLQEEDLAELAGDATFQALLKAGYEQIASLLSSA